MHILSLIAPGIPASSEIPSPEAILLSTSAALSNAVSSLVDKNA
jgi:hypothetical protein